MEAKNKILQLVSKLGSRRIHLAGITDNPDSAWVTQQARQFVWNLEENVVRFIEMSYLQGTGTCRTI